MASWNGRVLYNRRLCQSGGLEFMTTLKLALIPVDHAMAVKKRWGNMPLPEIIDRLDKATNHFVLRIDRDVPRQLAGRVSATDLFYEVSIESSSWGSLTSRRSACPLA